MKIILGSLLASIAIAIAATPAAAQYPVKPIRIIIGFAAGGPTDLVARALAQDMTAALGQSVIVENRTGANALIATVAVAKAPADGYTLLYNSLNHTINPLLMKNAGYDPIRDFAPISLMQTTPSILVLGAGQPYGSVRDLVQAAKAKPGAITFGSAGNGGSAHLTAELLKSQSGVNMVHVPFRGNAPAMTDVMGGNVTFMFYPISGLQEFLGTKRLKALAITTGARHPLFPDVPTMKEQGYAGFEDSHSWSGMLAPAGTPADVIQKLSDTLMKSAAGGAMKKRGEQTGSTIVGSTPKEFAAFLAKDGERWRRVLDSAGIKPE